MSNFEKLSVDENGLTQLVELLGRDCNPTQFVREFVRNSIEAIQRVQDTDVEDNYFGKIVVDFDKIFYQTQELFKLSFTDNGDGMTGEEMVRHLNRLSSSGHQNTYKNYGVGAKIAALTRNHAGIIYRSWKNGVGSQIFIEYNGETKSYGIKPLVLEDGSIKWSPEASDDKKPDIISDHGTQVILLGMDLEQDTMTTPSPNTRGGKENWLFQYINTRFYRLPKNIKIDVRVAYDKPGKSTSYLGNIIGQSEVLDKCSLQSGLLKLSDAQVFWKILDPERGSGHAREFINGHTACLNQNEIFEIKEGRANKAADFGIFVGKEHIALVIEPSSDYLQNTSRTALVHKDGSDLPWERWADEFRENMPPEIKKYIEDKLASMSPDSNVAAIKERLKSIAKLIKLSRFKKQQNGEHVADPDSEVRNRAGGGSDTSSNSKGGTRLRSGGAAGALEEILLSGLKDDGVSAIKVSPDSFPELRWATPEEDDQLVDRAAVYYERDNTIIANSHFQGISDVTDHFVKLYPDSDEAALVITPLVKEGFEQQLLEVVYGALSFKSRPNWNPTQFQSAISPEALTTSVMCRYYLMQQVNRRVRDELGKPPET